MASDRNPVKMKDEQLGCGGVRRTYDVREVYSYSTCWWPMLNPADRQLQTAAMLCPSYFSGKQLAKYDPRHVLCVVQSPHVS